MQENEKKKTTTKKTTTTKKNNVKKDGVSSKKSTAKKEGTKKAATTTKTKARTKKAEAPQFEKGTTKINEVEPKQIINDNKEKILTTSFSLFEVILIIVITILSCLLVFSFVKQSIDANDNDITDNDYTKDDIELFLEQYNYILNNYYGELNKEELLKAAVKGMLSELDDYSQFIDEESNSFSITLEGEYEGIGISIYNDGYGNIVIDSIYENTPAERAGLKVNDIIKKFNDTDLTNVSTTDLVNMIASTDEMTLTVDRNGKEIVVNIKREKIILNSVSYKMLENKIGYIDVDIFANNTPEQFKDALDSLENKQMKSLIIDLRDNTGGHLTSVEEMLYLFLDDSNIIYQTEDKTVVEEFYSQGNKNKTYDIVILQNGASASASEIMASALKENLNAYIIGTKSFGKGTVQTLTSMNDYQYKITTKKWLTSKGSWIDGIGISPDLEVMLSEKYYLNPVVENDNQLKAAIDYLNS